MTAKYNRMLCLYQCTWGRKKPVAIYKETNEILFRWHFSCCNAIIGNYSKFDYSGSHECLSLGFHLSCVVLHSPSLPCHLAQFHSIQYNQESARQYVDCTTMQMNATEISKNVAQWIIGMLSPVYIYLWIRYYSLSYKMPFQHAVR